MNNVSSSNQSRDRDDLKNTLSVPQAEEKLRVELPNVYRQAPVEILGEDGQVMISGLITGYGDRGLTVSRRPGGLSFKLCEIGSSVAVRGCDSKMTQFCLRAVVAESSRTHMRLKDLEKKEAGENFRNTYRLMVNTPIFVFDQDDEHMMLPSACTLVDISTSGCCIFSKDIHEEGEVLRLRIRLEDCEAVDLVGEVIRVTKCGDKSFRYGVLFAQLKEDELEALTWMLFNLQLGNRRKYNWGSASVGETVSVS